MRVPDQLLDARFNRSRRNAGFLESIPTEDPRQTNRTMSPDQLRISMLAIDMEPKELRALFGLTKSVYHNWSSGRTAVPKGIADYLRLKVAQRIRAMSIATGTPVQLDEDTIKPSTHRSLSAIESILIDLQTVLGDG